MTIRDDDWVKDFLVCPKCLDKMSMTAWSSKPVQTSLLCVKCDTVYNIENGIPIFNTFPTEGAREYRFEIDRYNKVAKTPPSEYKGFDESYPKIRAKHLAGMIGNDEPVLNVGQGFGLLEKKMPLKMKYCLDLSIEFLRLVQKEEIPNTRLVMGFGEMMPFPDESMGAVVSDGVFQAVVNQREFLVENARVLKSGGTFALTIPHKWNYPRKPQMFPVSNRKLLIHFLDELEIDAKMDVYKLPDMRKSLMLADGDYTIFSGKKR